MRSKESPNIFDFVDFSGDEIQCIDEKENVTVSHQAIRSALEEHLQHAWHVTEITEQRKTTYIATLATQAAPDPTYMLSCAEATLNIELIESGPVSTVVFAQIVDIPKKKMHFQARLMSDGKLRITECQREIPTKTFHSAS